MILSLEMRAFLLLTKKLLILIPMRQSWVLVFLIASLCMLKFFSSHNWSKLSVQIIMVKSYLLVLAVLLIPRKYAWQQRKISMLTLRNGCCLSKRRRPLLLQTFLLPSSSIRTMLVLLLKFLLIKGQQKNGCHRWKGGGLFRGLKCAPNYRCARDRCCLMCCNFFFTWEID